MAINCMKAQRYSALDVCLLALPYVLEFVAFFAAVTRHTAVAWALCIAGMLLLVVYAVVFEGAAYMSSAPSAKEYGCNRKLGSSLAIVTYLSSTT